MKTNFHMEGWAPGLPLKKEANGNSEMAYCLIKNPTTHNRESEEKKWKKGTQFQKKPKEKNHFSIKCNKQKGRENHSMCCNVSGQSWMNWIKLAKESVKASGLKNKCWIYRLWTVVNGQWSLKNYFNHCSTGWNCFQRLHINVQAEESEFQTSVPWPILIKMKTHSQFISMNWNITSPKMVRNSIVEG